MKQFLLASHGKFAEGILGSFQMILGYAPNITVLCAYTKENEETLEHTVKKIICERNRKEDLIVVTDVFGGSVNNEFMKYLNEPGVYLVTGMNLPLLLELYSNQNMESRDMIRLAIASAQNNLKFCTDLLQVKGEEEEF